MCILNFIIKLKIIIKELKMNTEKYVYKKGNKKIKKKFKRF